MARKTLSAGYEISIFNGHRFAARAIERFKSGEISADQLYDQLLADMRCVDDGQIGALRAICEQLVLAIVRNGGVAI